MRTKTAPVLLAAALIAGCSSFEQTTNEVGATHDATISRLEALRKAKEPPAITPPTATRQKVDGAWITNASSPVAVQRRPVAFDQHIEISPNRQLSISEVAERVTLLTGMPVNLAPDVYRGSQSTSIASFEGTTEELLKRLAGGSRLSMRVEDNSVTLFRYETAILRVKRKPGKLVTKTDIGVSGASSATSSGTTSNGEMSATVGGQANFDPWAELAAKVKAVMTPEGKLEAAAASSTIVVTDVPEAVALARKIVDDDNKLATTAINVKVEVINVSTDDDQNLGINWNLVFAELEAGNPLATLSFASPATMLTGNVGAFKVAVPTGSTSRFANSDFLIQALNKVGKAQTLLRRDFTTIHNVPSGFSRTNSKSYRAKTTAAPASSVGGGGQVGVEPGQVTTGTRFVVTPTYLGDGEFAVELAYNDSFLRELVTLGTGQQQIDAPDVDGNQIFSVTTLKMGETSILNTFELDSVKAANQGLTASTTSQMSSTKTKTRIYMLVTVTGGPQ